MRLALTIALLCSLLFPHLLLAAASSEALALEAARSDQWRKQLYLSDHEVNGRYQPRVNSNAFYFSDTNRVDPQRELMLSQRAIFANLDNVNDRHPLCRFPGRFLYLNSVLKLGHDSSLLEQCGRFQSWAQFDRYDSLSIVLVEGYYGNPASSFGHLVLRHGRSDGTRKLLDTSINFGARVPEGDGTLRYIVSGLTGGYQASFTAESYYRQDLVYTQVEQRDMWQYELALSDRQRLFFMAHIWELLDSPSTYYFLKNNCAFAVAEVLEIVFEEELVNQNTLFYPPVTLFHELDLLHQQQDRSIVRSRAFIPSQQRVLRSLYHNLSPQQRSAFSRFINSANPATADSLAGLTEADAAEVIESLISYYGYLISGYPELGTDLYDRRRALIVARLAYPAGRFLQETNITPGTEPGKTARVSRVKVGVTGTDNRVGGLIGWAPYSQSPTDKGNNDFSELTILALEGRFDENSAEVGLGIIRVAQRSNALDRLPGDWPLSWTIDLGWQSDSAERYRAGGQVDLELGQSLRGGPFLLSLLGAVRQSGWETGIGVRGEFGYASGNRMSWLGYAETTRWVSGHSTGTGLDARFGVSPQWSIDAGVSLLERDDETPDVRFSMAANWHYR